MKKVLSLILGLALVFSLGGCAVSTTKDVLTAESFKTYFADKEDYVINDITYQCEGMPIVTALACDDRHDGYALEFYIYEDETSAQKAYDENFEIYSQFAKEPLITEGDNYQKFAGSGGLSFWTLTKVGNTLLMCDGPKQFQEEISALVIGLGY